MPKPINYERQLTKAVGHLQALLKDTAARTHGGTRSTVECLGCERTGVHKPTLTCPCSCHAARVFLVELADQLMLEHAA